MKASIFIQLLLFTLFLSGCNKWDNDPNEKGCITRIENESHEIIAEYRYNKSGILEESWDHNQFYMEDKNAEYSYTFNSKGELIGKKGFEPGNMIMSSMTGAMDKKIECNYRYNENGLIDSVSVAYNYEGYPDINFTRAYSYFYTTDDLISKITYYIHPAANSIFSYDDFVFDKNGNIVEINSFTMITPNEKRIYSKMVFTYDKKNAPRSFEPGPVPKNNKLTSKTTVYNYDNQGNQSIGYSYEYTYEYIYNEDGYPEKETETYPNEIKNISYYFYE